MLAFAVLAFLARFAFRSNADWAILVRLSLPGAVIEVPQAIAALHRDSHGRDWLWNTGGSLAGADRDEAFALLAPEVPPIRL
jgi:hypothetical protein